MQALTIVGVCSIFEKALEQLFKPQFLNILKYLSLKYIFDYYWLKRKRGLRGIGINVATKHTICHWVVNPSCGCHFDWRLYVDVVCGNIRHPNYWSNRQWSRSWSRLSTGDKSWGRSRCNNHNRLEERSLCYIWWQILITRLNSCRWNCGHSCCCGKDGRLHCTRC